MYDQYLHAYQRLSLQTAGIMMGLILILIHIIPLLAPKASMQWLTAAHKNVLLGRVTLGMAMGWFMLLLIDSNWNPLSIELYVFEPMRGALILLCPVIWFVLSTMVKENLFPRALGLLILLAVNVPLTAAFLKDPMTRLLIPIYCYPILTAAMFWVAKPYLFRDWMNWLAARPALIRYGSIAGVAYGALILAFALISW